MKALKSQHASILRPLAQYSGVILTYIRKTLSKMLSSDINSNYCCDKYPFQSLPDGAEVGNYVVLDFGGKFFRIAYVNIKKENRI